MDSDLLMLMIYSNPEDTERLRLDRERKALTAVIDGAGLAASRFKILEAVTFDEVLKEVPAKPYSLIHFSGHGEKYGLFVEEGDNEWSAVASIDMIEKLLEAAQPHLKIAVFLSCFSSEYADRLIAHVPYILATVGRTDDAACVRFVDCLYTRLLEGDDIEAAFRHAQSRVPALDIVLRRRATRDGKARALVHSSSYVGHPILYVDISAVEEDVERFGLSSDDLVNLMSRKIYYHAFAFRYPRSDAILSMGELFASFSWEDSADAIACTNLYKLKSDADERLAKTYVELLIDYSDRYVAAYRSPSARYDPHFEDQLGFGLARMINTCSYFLGYVSDNEPPSRFEPHGLSATPELLMQYCPDVFRTACAVGNANLASAERKFIRKDFGGATGHLEAALSSLHDVMTAIGKLILE